MQRHRIERFGPHFLFFTVRGEKEPVSVLEPIDLEGSSAGIDEPERCDAGRRVFRHLAYPVETTRRRRDHLAHPVGCEVEPGGVGIDRHPLASPPGEIRNEHIAAQVQFRLVDDPPAAGAAITLVEPRNQPRAENRRSACVPAGWPGDGDQVSIDQFRDDPDCRVFTASLRAGGLGIDLTSASVVIHYDRWWNQAREDQATDRVHRLGQNKGVQVIKLITRNTIEEKIDALITRKAALAGDLIRPDDPSLVKQFTKEELEELLEEE